MMTQCEAILTSDYDFTPLFHCQLEAAHPPPHWATGIFLDQRWEVVWSEAWLVETAGEPEEKS